jgi:hypothetical protein
VESIQGLDLGISAADRNSAEGVRVSFGRERHQGLDEVYFTVIEKGRFVPLTDWSRWRQ